ncbi:MAG: Na+/H+ antiporter NhaC family protein [Myxococcota bacterium]
MHRTQHNNLIWSCLPLTLFSTVFGLLLVVYVAMPAWAISIAKAVPTSAVIAFVLTVALSPGRRLQMLRAAVAGASQSMVLQMGLIFVVAGLFAALGRAIGSVDALVAMSLHLLPQQWLLPGLFVASCITSLAMGTSMGTLAAVVPIAVGVAAAGGALLPICVATVMGGAMFGDNLSVISDTTIAATKTQGCSMRSKLLANGPVALLAACISVALLLLLPHSPTSEQPPLNLSTSWAAAWPYGCVLLLAVCGLPVLWVLAMGIGLCLITGIVQGSLSLIQLPGLVLAGCSSMLDVLLATFSVAALVQVLQTRGGLQALLNALRRHVHSPATAEVSIATMAVVADICTANNTIAILLCGPLVQRTGEQFELNRARCASLLDIYACLPQGLLPYGAQMLLATALSGVSPLQILPYVIYPVLLAVFASIGIVKRIYVAA